MKKYKGTHTLVNTEAEGYDYAEYVDWCECNDIEPCGEGSSEYWEWVYEEVWVNYEMDMDNIKDYAPYNNKVRLNGHIGAWDGSHEIVEYEFDSVYDAIVKCNSGDYNHTMEVVWKDGIIEVTICHHDGKNCFVITPYDRRRKFDYLYDC